MFLGESGGNLFVGTGSRDLKWRRRVELFFVFRERQNRAGHDLERDGLEWDLHSSNFVYQDSNILNFNNFAPWRLPAGDVTSFRCLSSVLETCLWKLWFTDQLKKKRNWNGNWMQNREAFASIRQLKKKLFRNRELPKRVVETLSSWRLKISINRHHDLRLRWRPELRGTGNHSWRWFLSKR